MPLISLAMLVVTIFTLAVVLTAMGIENWSGPQGDTLRSRTPLRRFAEPEEIANAVLFLVSSGCNILTGQSILLEGGLTIC